MNRNATRALLGALALGTSAAASADVINVTLNPAVTDPLVTYVGDSDGYPTPLDNPTSTYAQSVFTAMDSIYVAEMFDLQSLDSTTDEIFESADTLTWHAVWYDPMGVEFAYNLVNIAWSDIVDWQTNGDTVLPIAAPLTTTDTLMAGNYTVVTYVEGQGSNYTQFSYADVPEPSSLLLMSLGLLAVGYRATRKKA
jgi:hypothetical protein